MKTWAQTIGAGRSAIEVRVTVKEHHERTPEEHRLAAEADRRILGEPTPEMYERAAKKRGRKTRAA
jgi:hypothetical protein